ncbi:hypothetical protein K3740_12705 [Ruegeria conchae]|uniref:hypothetical protein n=1 Tax=Ruegeria conchae TaxID=981384 RepID=UPI0021A823A5|nr:hypothetical protein [Ruegeria conchae]UWR01915.1 hypothetical protein K3740_12705 [Ruegeria conchae]
MSAAASQTRPTWKWFGFATSFLSKMIGPSTDIEVHDQEGRAHRDFILDMMDAHPEALQHEMDFETLMRFYPSRF